MPIPILVIHNCVDEHTVFSHEFREQRTVFRSTRRLEDASFPRLASVAPSVKSRSHHCQGCPWIANGMSKCQARVLHRRNTRAPGRFRQWLGEANIVCCFEALSNEGERNLPVWPGEDHSRMSALGRKGSFDEGVTTSLYTSCMPSSN